MHARHGVLLVEVERTLVGLDGALPVLTRGIGLPQKMKAFGVPRINAGGLLKGFNRVSILPGLHVCEPHATVGASVLRLIR